MKTSYSKKIQDSLLKPRNNTFYTKEVAAYKKYPMLKLFKEIWQVVEFNKFYLFSHI